MSPSVTSSPESWDTPGAAGPGYKFTQTGDQDLVHLLISEIQQRLESNTLSDFSRYLASFHIFSAEFLFDP